ncbi:peptidoglycan-binding protein [Phenylobacterium sp.]|uniref:peptidoglycan-binding protein n=1 Tax=Phenylobacterium sp. TaxID=1871053 RepID=UPI001214FE52|nr:peptidoglycan-binding protein [Phenylobacterium sp.]THD64752.1 MAG: Localization factor PodJS [Phenylobacterium sp.]
MRAAIEAPTSYMPSPPFSSRPFGALEPRPEGARTDELGRIAAALDRLTDRIEASETRTGLAISGVEHSVRHAMARIETAEREHLAVATRFDAAAEQLAAEQARASERMRRVEHELSGPRSAEAIKALEESMARVSSQTLESEERARSGLAGLEARLAHIEAGEDPAAVIDEAVARLGARLAEAEARTGDALEGLRDSLGQLDQRMYAADRSVRGDTDQRLTALADELSKRVEDARGEIAERLAASGAAPGLAEARLGEVERQLAAVDQRSARAIETIGREVLTMAETLNRRVQSAEQRSAEAIEQVGGEIARIAGAVESRLGRTDQLHAEALERLGSEIGRITERLTDRIIQSERRAAQAIDDVGEQVAKVTERIEQRHERAAGDLAERIRQSEERTQRLVESLSVRPADAEPEAQPFAAAPVQADVRPEPQAEAAEDDLPAAPGVFGAELFSRAEPVTLPALDPSNPAFSEEDFAHVDAFAPAGGYAPIAEGEDEEHHHLAPASEALEAPTAADEPVSEEDAERETRVEVGPSTREVIEQARAAARAAAAAAPRPKLLYGRDRRPRAMGGGGLFASLKARPPSTWQTALMVAGGAAFLSVGAAGVVLMEGPGPQRAQHDALAFGASPRAAVALTPGPVGPSLEAMPAPAEAAADLPPPVAVTAPSPAAPAASDASNLDYLKIAKAVTQKEPGALARLKAVADGGYAPAQMFLARLYETGQADVSKNLGEARRWTMRAAEAGDPTAMHNLALFYFRGEGGPADAAAAAQWFKTAAEHGVVDSQYNLGLLYQSGSGVPRDLAQAYKWFSIAAESGDGEARASAVDLEGKLPQAQLAQAESQAAAFRPQGAAPAPDASAPGASLSTAQKILGRLGYYKGKPDGTNSHDLKLAVIAYQRDQGLAATGALDPATVARLSVFDR